MLKKIILLSGTALLLLIFVVAQGQNAKAMTTSNSAENEASFSAEQVCPSFPAIKCPLGMELVYPEAIDRLGCPLPPRCLSMGQETDYKHNCISSGGDYKESCNEAGECKEVCVCPDGRETLAKEGCHVNGDISRDEYLCKNTSGKWDECASACPEGENCIQMCVEKCYCPDGTTWKSGEGCIKIARPNNTDQEILCRQTGGKWTELCREPIIKESGRYDIEPAKMCKEYCQCPDNMSYNRDKGCIKREVRPDKRKDICINTGGEWIYEKDRTNTKGSEIMELRTDTPGMRPDSSIMPYPVPDIEQGYCKCPEGNRWHFERGCFKAPEPPQPPSDSRIDRMIKKIEMRIERLKHMLKKLKRLKEQGDNTTIPEVYEPEIDSLIHEFEEVLNSYNIPVSSTAEEAPMMMEAVEVEAVPEPRDRVISAKKIKAIKAKHGLIPFEDVDENSDFLPYIEKAKVKGIFGGSNGKFEGHRNITQAEVLKSALEAAGIDASTPPDQNEIANDPNLRRMNDWQRRYYKAAKEKGIVGKYFDPNSPASRAQAVGIMMRAVRGISNIDPRPSTTGFADTSPANPYAGEIKAAKDMGVVSGQNGYFNPALPVKRNEMAKIIVGAIEE